ncbi:MAG: hypothetical protein LCH54_10620 [Bacteroidetes bacterium]|nr:hypothetical protein [Bacteroidota bacterium]
MSASDMNLYRVDTNFRFLAEYTLYYSDKVESLFFNDFESIQKWLNKNDYVKRYTIYKFSNNEKMWMLSEDRNQPVPLKSVSTFS